MSQTSAQTQLVNAVVEVALVENSGKYLNQVRYTFSITLPGAPAASYIAWVTKGPERRELIRKLKLVGLLVTDNLAAQPQHIIVATDRHSGIVTALTDGTAELIRLSRMPTQTRASA